MLNFKTNIMKKMILLLFILSGFGVFSQTGAFPYQRQWATFNPQGQSYTTTGTNTLKSAVLRNGNTVVVSSSDLNWVDTLLPIEAGSTGKVLLGILNAEGEYQLARKIFGTSSDSSYLTVAGSLTTDVFDNFYIAGSTTDNLSGIGTPGTHQPNFSNNVFQDTIYYNGQPFLTAPKTAREGFIAKFDPEGNQLWGTYFSGNKEILNPYICEKDGYLYITGGTDSQIGITTPGTYVMNYAETPYSARGFIMKFDAETGQKIWGTYMSPTENNGLYGYRVMAIDSEGNFYYTNTNNNGLIKLNAAGQFAAEFFLEEGLGISGQFLIDEEDNLYVFSGNNNDINYGTEGTYKPYKTLDNERLVTKYDSDFQKIWATYFNDNEALASEETKPSLSKDGKEDLLIGFRTSLPGLASTGSFQTENEGNGDHLLMSLDTRSGTLNWATYYGSPEEEQKFFNIETDSLGNIYATGLSKSEDGVITDNAQFTAADFGYINSSRAYIVKFERNNTADSDKFFNYNFVVYPNPADNEVFLQFNEYQKGTLAIYDVNGKKVFTMNNAEVGINKPLTIDVSNFASGVYILQWTGNQVKTSMKLIKK